VVEASEGPDASTAESLESLVEQAVSSTTSERSPTAQRMTAS
jgi:hypothetical protein